MRSSLRVIDSISEWTGKTAHWLATALVLLISFEVIMRYSFNAPTNWNYETSMMIGGVLYVFGWAYVHLHHAHVRVDVFYVRLPPRARAAIDVIGALLLFFPLIFLFVKTSFVWTLNSWQTGEISAESSWYPPLAPFRAAVTIGFALFALQGGAQFVRDLYFLIRNKTYD